MLRLWARAGLCLLATVACVAAQSGGHHNTNPRIGLVADTLGLNPVGDRPGFSQPIHDSGLQQCFCLQVNQQCPFDSGVIDINVRIVNQRPLVDGKCPEVNPNLCCPPGQSTTPEPFPPLPGSCGQRFDIPTSIRPTGAEARFGEYPWTVVVLDNRNQFLGAGVLISNQFVLTAAHKVTSRRNLNVRLGDYDLQSPQDHESLAHIEVPIVETIIHPDFNSETLQNDVALLRMEYPVDFSRSPHIGEACLPDQDQKFEGQRACFVSGWGKDSFEDNGRFQRIMKEVDLPIVEGFTCEIRLRETRLGPHYKLDTNSFLCAGGISGKDACTGDGGAPLVCPTPRGYVVVGLVAWGIGCGTSNVPGVYVNVPNFINFIRRYV